MSRMPFRLRTLILSAIAAVVVLAPVAAYAQPARAPGNGLGAGFPVAITGSLPEAVNSAYDNIISSLTRAGVLAFFNAATVFFGQIAYDTATAIASGGKGQEALIFKKNFGDYLQDVASDAAGEFIGSLSDDFFETRGFDLCQPTDPRTLLRLQLSLGGLLGVESKFQRPRPRCDLREIINNYENLATAAPDDALDALNFSFTPGGSDLGVTTQIFGRSIAYVMEESKDAERDRVEGRGFRSVTGLISGTIKTPASVVGSATEEFLVKGPYQQKISATEAILQTAFEQGPVQLAAYTASVFLNTLTSKLLQRIFEKGLFGAFDFSSPSRVLTSPDAIETAGKTDARKANIDLRTPSLLRASDVEIVSELVACPADARGVWNCSMDQDLAQAIQGKGEAGGITIRQALEEGKLHRDWRLLPATFVKENRDRLCYTYAYCVGNIKKLRAARILPVGVEFAADAKENRDRCATSRGCATLGEVVDGFTNCNANGDRDGAHPWCKLIDPNWVLTSVPQQCRLGGFGDTLLTDRLPQRREECQDIQTCLKRNDRGECVGGYGYCLAEKTVYRFSGDECPARYASCRSYTTRAGQNVSYLRNTLDYGVCSAENAGCYWYSTRRAADGTWVGTGGVGTAGTSDKFYADKTLAGCSADQDGCTKLLGFRPGQSALNLVLNPSFEEVSGAVSALATWMPDDRPFTAPVVTEGAASITGGASYQATADPLRQEVAIEPGRTHTLSVFARTVTAAAGSLDITLVQAQKGGISFDLTRIPETGGIFRSDGCRAGGVGFDDSDLTTAWQRLECTFLSDDAAGAARIEVRGANAMVDSIQLEEGEFATAFIDGVASELDVVSLKVPQDDLNCTGEDTDGPACARFARICRQTEAGCQGYTDALSGGAEIPAIVSTNDLCPTSCVGYAEYRKQPSAFDFTRDVDTRFDDPTDPVSAYFIPSTASQCRREDVGCEEFTNVGAVAEGGEDKSYFSYLRACETPDANTRTYFTWEGSESTGFQLRTWSLKREAPAAGGGTTGPRVVVKRAPGQSFYKEPAQCNESSWQSGADPDCRQFYDADGTVFYRYYSQTVLSSDQCRTLRISRTSQVDCEKTGGAFNPATGACVYQAYAPESLSCRAEAAGCRAYNGPSSGNVQNVLVETFREGFGAFTAGEVSSEALLVGDQSLRIGGGATVATAVLVPTDPAALYTMTFWAKVPARTDVSVTIGVQSPGDPASRIVAGQVALTADWQRLSVGPFTGVPDETTSELHWAFNGTAGVPAAVFIDEVTVQRVDDVAYVRIGTWNTPAECDSSPAGAPQPQAMLGCRAYNDRFGQKVNARQFSRLCRQAAVGCRAFVDTRNSESIGSESFTLTDASPVPVTNLPGSAAYGPTTAVRAADRYAYYIDTPEMRCKPENQSCRAFGKPKFSADHSTIESFDTVYLKDDITKYSQALCRPSEMFCEEFKTGTDTAEYFRDPQNHACEYRDNVQLTAESAGVPGLPSGAYSGWFIKETDRPCYPDARDTGLTFSIVRRGDLSYDGYAGICSASFGECTEFRDPRDHSDPRYRSGKPYYFISNERLDTTSCGGNVDLARGCVLVRDMSKPGVTYSSLATYSKYDANNAQPTPPLNCDVASPDPACTKVKACRGTRGTLTYSSQRLVGGSAGAGGGAAGLGPLAGATIPTTGLRTPIRITAGFASPEYVTQEWIGEKECTIDADCNYTECFDASGRPATENCATQYVYQGTCTAPGVRNDTNTVMKVKLDRDCTQWLGCRSAETVLDPGTGNYRDVCTNLALCDASSERAGDIFCSNYVNRTTTGTEPILNEGAFFDADRYASRRTGLGEKDYSGYSIPNSFLPMDVASVRVAFDGANNVPDAKRRFSTEYRLAGAVKIKMDPVGTAGRCVQATTAGGDQALVIPATEEPQRAYPTLNLCRHVGTGAIGYYSATEMTDAEARCAPVYCYLPLNWQGDASNFHNLSSAFSQLDPTVDTRLSAAYPPAECRANPEPDSPFSSRFVSGWDLTKNPPATTGKLAGYQNVNTCEYGEDCVCGYKRAEYSVTTKFYGIFSDAVPPGVCQGGPRNGQACLPSTIYSLPSQRDDSGGPEEPAGTVIKAIEGANAAQTCGPPEAGGQCVAWSKLEIVRGVFGQCLERDTTRIMGGDESLQPCLTWNPTPILFGEKDPYHFQPSSGYLPPQNSGQYYCTSYAREPRSLKLGGKHFRTFDCGSERCYAGKMYRMGFNDDLVSEEADIGDDGDPGARLDGGYPGGSDTASQCEYADDDQDDGGNDRDTSALRLVSSGRGLDQTYTETFFPIDSQSFAQWVSGNESLTDGTTAATAAAVNQALNDFSIAFFSVQPITNSNGRGRLACGYQADWVDGLGAVDYDDGDKSAARDAEWRLKFFQNYNPTMTRGTESFLEDKNGHPLRAPCVRGQHAGEDEGDQLCYFKFWETGYRHQSQMKFVGLQTLGANNEPLDEIRASLGGDSIPGLQHEPYYRACSSDKPYFAIRTVFEVPVNDVRNNSGAVFERESLRPDDIFDGWHFVGFWTTTCAGKSEDERYIYLTVEAHSADICRQVAEVRSRDSRQDAAFTDRIWKDGRFTVPGTGTLYNARSSPFSSALNTGPAGADPLFQTGGSIAGFSPLNPPSFLQSGTDTYFRSSLSPRDKYAYLSNLFARVYRLYSYHYKAVTKFDYACITGPFKGRSCLGVLGDGINRRSDCGYDGVCVTSLMTPAERATLRTCNIDSGLNVATRCSRNEDCKAPIRSAADGSQEKLLTTCEVRPGWAEDISDDPTVPSNPGLWRFNDGPAMTLAQARDAEAFGCADNSARAGEACNNPREVSSDCPLLVTGECVRDVCINLRDADNNLVDLGDRKTCRDSSDCRFTSEANYNNAECVSMQADLTPSGVIGFTTNDEGSPFLAVGRCSGGIREGSVCGLHFKPDGSAGGPDSPNDNLPTAGTTYSCAVDTSPLRGVSPEAATLYAQAFNACQAVSNRLPTPGFGGIQFSPVDACRFPDDRATVAAITTGNDPDNDNNICTHSAGYYPDLNLCPDPKDEFCGLLSYKITNQPAQGGSLDPRSLYPLPTDVTMGLYTPLYLGYVGGVNGPERPSFFSYIAYYTPRPPRIAAPDTRECSSGGACPIQRMDAFSFANQTEGIVTADGGQFKANLRFYGWAAHEQMPLRKVVLDWGDDQSQDLPDTRLKNKKPYCGVQKECSDPIRGAGLTCQSDSDCPPGTGACLAVGTCTTRPHVSCHTDSDCSVGTSRDTCNIRTMFGNSTDACEAGFFDFTHLYTCNGPYGLPFCDETSDPDVRTEARCSRDPERSCSTNADCAAGDTCIARGLAPKGGCWDPATNSCRFTPRLMLQDNWGWCSGECRAIQVAGSMDDAPSATVKHPFGGCYSGRVHNELDPTVRFNTPPSDPTDRSGIYLMPADECSESFPTTSGINTQKRPWIVFPGSLQLRSSGELVLP